MKKNNLSDSDLSIKYSEILSLVRDKMKLLDDPVSNDFKLLFKRLFSLCYECGIISFDDISGVIASGGKLTLDDFCLRYDLSPMGNDDYINILKSLLSSRDITFERLRGVKDLPVFLRMYVDWWFLYDPGDTESSRLKCLNNRLKVLNDIVDKTMITASNSKFNVSDSMLKKIKLDLGLFEGDLGDRDLDSVLDGK